MPMIEKISRWAAWLFVAAALFLTVGPQRFRPYTGIEHDLEHFAALAVVGFAFGLGYPRLFWRSVVCAVVLAGTAETIQRWIPRRHGTLDDFLVNAAGVCAGLVAAALVHRLASRLFANKR